MSNSPVLKEDEGIKKKETFIFSKLKSLSTDIHDSIHNVQEAKKNRDNAKTNYENVPKWRIFTRNKAKKEYEESKDKLIDVLTDNQIITLRIMGKLIGVVFLVALLPLDLFQLLGRFVVNGFKKRDDAFVKYANKR